MNACAVAAPRSPSVYDTISLVSASIAVHVHTSPAPSGISSGATLAAIAQKLPELGENPRVLGFNYDTGERYLSVADFLPEEQG